MSELNSDALISRLRAHLETTGRARNQLPPVATYRRGLFARLEIWFKRQARRATRWYAWEQVNFNSATHDALGDLLQLLMAFDERLTKLETAERGGEHAAWDASLIPAEMTSGASTSTVESDPATLTAAEVRRLQAEQRERIRLMLEEMRVSFKQLLMELSEMGALSPEADSNAKSRLDDLQSRIEELSELSEKI